MTNFVSIVVPVYNEEAYMEAMLESIYANNVPESTYEVIVIDGMSTDGTRDIVKRFMKDHPNLSLLDNPNKTVPYAMNIGIRAAKGEVIIRVDGHAEVAPEFIRTCLEELEAHPECACVGGYIENVNENDIAEAVALAMTSPFGVGNAMYRFGTYEGYVDTLLFGAYRREVFDDIGLFDEVLTRNQDDDLNYRLTKAGYKIWLSKRISSKYYVRGSFPKLYRQFKQYGYWKVYVNRKHRTVTTLRQLAPIALVLAFIFLGVAALFSDFGKMAFTALLFVYLGTGVAATLAKTREPATFLRVLAAFITMHFAYGFGYLEGLIEFMVLQRTPSSRNAQVSR